MVLRPILKEQNVQRINLWWFSQFGELLTPLLSLHQTDPMRVAARAA